MLVYYVCVCVFVVRTDRINAILKNLWLEDMEETWPFPEGEWPDSEEEWHQLLYHQLTLRWKQTTRYRDKITTMLKRLEKVRLSGDLYLEYFAWAHMHILSLALYSSCFGEKPSREHVCALTSLQSTS